MVPQISSTCPRRRYILGLLVVALIAFGSTAPLPASAQQPATSHPSVLGDGIDMSRPWNQAELDSQLEFRRTMGLSTDAGLLNALALNPQFRAERGEQEWGKLLTPAEYVELERREQVGHAAQQLLREIHASVPEDQFGTLWQDHQDGGRIHVSLVDAAPGVRERLLLSFPFQDEIEFHSATVSLSELEAVYTRLVDHLGESGNASAKPEIAAVDVDEVAGEIVVNVEDLSSVKAELESLFPEVL